MNEHSVINEYCEILITVSRIWNFNVILENRNPGTIISQDFFYKTVTNETRKTSEQEISIYVIELHHSVSVVSLWL